MRSSFTDSSSTTSKKNDTAGLHANGCGGDLNNLATSIAGLADYSFHTLCATQSRGFCGIALIKMSM